MRKTTASRMILCGCVAALAALSGCSSNDSPAGASGSGGAGGSTGGAGGAGGSTGTCTSGALILFSPAYSAYDGGMHTFKIPLVAYGITDTVKWTANDPEAVDFDPDAVQFGDAGAAPGRAVMVTTRKAGTFTIRGQAGTACGETTLTVDQTTPEAVQLGNDRYNNGVPIDFRDGGRTPACTNCHGAMSGTMLDIIHTPQQTGGYSNTDLINIFTKGQKPTGVGCRTFTNCQIWSSFHKWDATEEEQKGLVYYLRSLEPAPQGDSSFGGRRDGG